MSTVTSTDVDLLERAAKILRQHAEATTPYPWRVGEDSPEDDDGVTWNVCGATTGGVTPIALQVHTEDAGFCSQAEADVAYAVLMHPPVALALAETFEKIAWMGRLDADLLARVGCDELIATARAILREEA